MKAVADLVSAAIPPAMPGLPVLRWFAVARERRALAGLDARALRDIGIEPDAARMEAARPFWDLPQGRC